MRISVLCLLPLAGVLEATLVPRAAGQSHSVPAHLVVNPENRGFKIPEGPDGRFSITYDPEGNSTEAIITTLELFDGRTVVSKRSLGGEQPVAINKRSHGELAKRHPHGELDKRYLPISEWGCERGSWHNNNDYDLVTILFGIACDNGIRIPAARHPAHSEIIYERVGASIAYACTFGGIQPCGSSEFNEFNTFITEKCGVYASGHIWMEEWCKGYGRLLSGEEACGHEDLH